MMAEAPVLFRLHAISALLLFAARQDHVPRHTQQLLGLRVATGTVTPTGLPGTPVHPGP
ncbi:hypothetical protein [Streptomyces sp. B4I13]|uniref:hypothetical protein n=1 Tax=Streptomyces sp. B4I13 TaxID=3042271 RepID=UPI0027D9111A|nr:hypothetical protein [Streptomyces sp. B4I13]